MNNDNNDKFSAGLNDIENWYEIGGTTMTKYHDH